MKKRCSIQQSEKDNCWSEQSPEKSTVSCFFFGATRYNKSALLARNAEQHYIVTLISVNSYMFLYYCWTHFPPPPWYSHPEGVYTCIIPKGHSNHHLQAKTKRPSSRAFCLIDTSRLSLPLGTRQWTESDWQTIWEIDILNQVPTWIS